MSDGQVKHTPGPWEISPALRDPRGYDHGIVGKRTPDEDDPEAPDAVTYVATVLGNATGQATAAANARLIAAAPDMLAVLQQVEWSGKTQEPSDAYSWQWFTACPCCVGAKGDEGHHPDCTLAAAIAKATRPA